MESASNEPVFATAAPGPFKVPRDFWKNAATSGLAERTNRLFVSQGTNFQMLNGVAVPGAAFALPLPGAATENVPVDQLSPAPPAEVLTYCGTNCTMTFVSTNDGSAEANPRASALSIFDQYLSLRRVTYPMGADGSPAYETDRIFQLNRYTIVEAHKRLLPTAIGYSAGLIDYFFRGKMEISPGEEGVYGIIDHADPVANQKDTGGFSKIKLKIKNVTPSGSAVEPMSTSGKFVAIVKFHRKATIDDCRVDNGNTRKGMFHMPDQRPPGYDPVTSPFVQGTYYKLSQQPPLAPVYIMSAPVGTLARVAYLLDLDMVHHSTLVTELYNKTIEYGGGDYDQFWWDTGPALVNINQMDRETKTMTITKQYLPGRGVYMPAGENPYLTSTSGGITPPDLQLIRSQVFF